MNLKGLVHFCAMCALVLFWVVVFMAVLYIPSFLSLYSGGNSINIATWTEMIDEEVVQQFERDTGISVHMSYFDNNDELLVKLYATGGVGYDLLIPSDYAIAELIKKDLLQPLDKTKLPAFDRVVPQLLHKYYDPENRYSIPYYWGIYGIGVQRSFFPELSRDTETWDIIFNPSLTHVPVVLLDSPKELILLATLYLQGSLEYFNKETQHAVKKLLLAQKPRVVAFTEFRADYLLLSGACKAAIIASPQMLRLAQVMPDIYFFVPQEGSCMVLDSWVIPKKSTKADLVYSFINYLYRPENIERHFNNLVFLPATVDIRELLTQHPSGHAIYAAHTEGIEKLLLYKNVVSQDEINDIWIALKA